MNNFTTLFVSCLFWLCCKPTCSLLLPSWEEYLERFPHIEIHALSKENFGQNIKYIIEHSAMGHSYTLGVTPFLHLSETEWKSRFYNISRDYVTSETFVSPSLRSGPSSWSWVSQGVTTPVKDQGAAGTCYENAAVETIETTWAIKTNNLLVLSVQQGVDCSKLNHGVNGGLPDYSYRYAMNTEKCLESDYPYTSGTTGKESQCHTCKGAVSKLSSFVDIKDGDEEAMKQAVLLTSLAVGIKADDKQFQMYKSGVLDYDCDSSEKAIDHAVAIYGYGTENGKDYWLVRNSWGEDWGEDGYIKMIRDKCMCGICHMASYPKF